MSLIHLFDHHLHFRLLLISLASAIAFLAIYLFINWREEKRLAKPKYSKDIFSAFPTLNYPESGTILRLKIIDETFNIIDALEILLGKERIAHE